MSRSLRSKWCNSWQVRLSRSPWFPAALAFEACIKVTRLGGTISNIGYHGHGDYLQIPRLEWGVGMSDKTIRTALCPGGRERMRRLLRLIETGRVDPTPLTTHWFAFDQIETAFHMMETK